MYLIGPGSIHRMLNHISSHPLPILSCSLAKELTDIKKNGTTPGITLLRADDLKTWFLSIEVLYPDLPNVPASTTTSTTERTPKQANTSEDEVDDEVVFISEKTKGGQETTVVDVDSVPPQKRARLVDFLGGSRRANGGGLDSAPSSPRLKQNSSGTPGSNSGTNMNDNANSKQNSGGTASRIGKTGGSPEGRMYEGQKFALKFVFEARYPIEAPQVSIHLVVCCNDASS